MLVNAATGEILAPIVVPCDTFWKRGRGLMSRGRRAVSEGQIFLFVEGRESIARAAIHMLFVFFPIAVIWLGGERQVVDQTLARPFRPYYAPRRAARYYVEGDPSLLERVRVGDRLEFA